MDKHYLIEHILNLMNFLQANGYTLEQLMEPDSAALPEIPYEIRQACEVIRFMDEIPGGFLIYFADGDERIIYANKGLLRIFQCETMQEFRSWTKNSFRGLVHPDDLEEVEESIREQISQSQYELDYVEYRITRRDGAVRWIEDYGHFIRCGEAGNIFYVFLGDATEKRDQIQYTLSSVRQQSEKQLQDLIETYDKERSLINQAYLRQLEVIQGLSINYDSIIYTDLEEDSFQVYRGSGRTDVITAKELHDSFSRYTAEYVAHWVCREDRDLVTETLSPDNIRQRLSSCDTYYINYRVTENGHPEYLQMRIAKASGSTSRVILGCRKVDDEIRQEMEQRKLLSEALTNANLAIVAKNTFLSNMSHDMRTPLNGILGYLTLAKEKAGQSTELMEYLDGAETSAQQMRSLVDEVLQTAWNDSNEAQTEETACDLIEIVQDVYQTLLPRAIGQGVMLSVFTSGLVHSTVYSRPDKIRQIIMYLTTNAVTYTNPGGNVSVTLTERPGPSELYPTFQLEVADTGIGMSEEFLAHIYEPFTRERNTTASGVHGSGLGLTIVKKIVDLMGGNIDVKSSPGKGSTFTITLRMRLQEETVTQPDSGAASVELGGQRVLLVDDNEINLKIEDKIFQHMGFRVDTAADGSIALDIIKNSRPGDYDLVLMDLQMPVMDGWQASREIRALANPGLSGIPIIALSANAFPGDIRKSMESGIDAHLTKPINVPELMNKVREVLHRREIMNNGT